MTATVFYEKLLQEPQIKVNLHLKGKGFQEITANITLTAEQK